jgi:hypothetical protein
MVRRVLKAETPYSGILETCSKVGTELLSSGYRAGSKAGGLDKVKQPCTCYTVALYLAQFLPDATQ